MLSYDRGSRITLRGSASPRNLPKRPPPGESAASACSVRPRLEDSCARGCIDTPVGETLYLYCGRESIHIVWSVNRDRRCTLTGFYLSARNAPLISDLLPNLKIREMRPVGQCRSGDVIRTRNGDSRTFKCRMRSKPASFRWRR